MLKGQKIKVQKLVFFLAARITSVTLTHSYISAQ